MRTQAGRVCGRVGVGVALALLTPALAAAQGPNVAPDASAPAPAPPERRESPARWLSRHVMHIGDNVDDYVASIGSPPEARRNETFDRFYGDRQREDEHNRSTVRVSPSIEFQDSDGDGVTLHLRINARLALPRSEGRLQLVFDSFDEDSDVLDTTLERRPPMDATGVEERPTLSLRIKLRETLHYRASIDTGVRFTPTPDPRIRARFRVWKAAGPVILRGTQSFFWELKDGVGEKTQFDVDRGSITQNLARATTSILWAEDSAGVSASEVLAISHALGRKRTIGLSAGVSSHLEPDAQVDKCTVQLPLRFRLHRNWLFMELTPGVDYPRERDFRESPFIILKFNFIFGYTEEG